MIMVMVVIMISSVIIVIHDTIGDVVLDSCYHSKQALMELGATVCTPKAPACDRCPLRAHCLAAARHTEGGAAVTSYPAKAARKPPRLLRFATAVVEERLGGPPPAPGGGRREAREVDRLAVELRKRGAFFPPMSASQRRRSELASARSASDEPLSQHWIWRVHLDLSVRCFAQSL